MTYDAITPETLVLEAQIIMQLLRLNALTAALEAAEMHYRDIKAYFEQQEDE